MAGFASPYPTAQADAKIKVDEKVDYSNLPCPVIYEEIHREAYSFMMGPTEVPSQSSEVIKIPTGNYEFGATYIDLPNVMLDRGKIDSNGVAAAYMEERLPSGLGFLLSAELDHGRKDYKFGFGVNVGDFH